MKNKIANEIKYAYQRIVRGYDDRIKWSFCDYFNQFLPPLKEFCKHELKDCYDGKRKEIFTTTLDLIHDYEVMPYENYYKEPNEETKLLEYIGKNLGYFWN